MTRATAHAVLVSHGAVLCVLSCRSRCRRRHGAGRAGLRRRTSFAIGFAAPRRRLHGRDDAARDLRRARARRRSRARQPPGGARGARDHGPHLRARQPRPPPRRRLRPVRPDALSGDARPRRRRPNARRRRPPARCCCTTASPASCSTTARRAAAAPRSRRTSGPAPTIRPICRRRTTMPAAALRRGRPSSSAADLLRALRAAGFRGDGCASCASCRAISPAASRDLKLDGLRARWRSPGQDLRVAVGRTLGWQYIKSTSFELRALRAIAIGSTATARPRRRPVRDRLGQAGRPWRRAPRRFSAATFPGSTIAAAGTPARRRIRRAAQPAPLRRRAARDRRRPPSAARAGDVLVSLPDGDEGERNAIAQLTRSARDDMARALGVPPPVARRRSGSTRRPTTTSARRPALVHVGRRRQRRSAPAAARRAARARRARAHDPPRARAPDGRRRSAKRPAWVREGAAIYFAGERRFPARSPRGPARPDAGAVSVGRRAAASGVGRRAQQRLRRARGCFARQIEGGKLARRQVALRVHCKMTRAGLKAQG